MGVIMHPDYRVSRVRSHEGKRFISPVEEVLQFELPNAVLCGAKEHLAYDFQKVSISMKHTQPRACTTNESTIANVQPWVSELLNDEHLGGGCVEVISDTVILTKRLVMKATTSLEVSILLRLHEVCPEIVPEPYTTYKASSVYRNVPSDCDTALLYHKVEGSIGSDLLEKLSSAYSITQDDVYLKQIMDVVNGSIDASKDLYHKGVVHQDFWMGNIIVSGPGTEINKDTDYSKAKYVFVDVGDCAKMAENSYTSSVGGFLIAAMGIILGTVLQQKPQPFTPQELWKGLPLPWWIHTHWEPVSAVVPPKMASCCEKVLDELLAIAGDSIVTKVGLLTHSERFLGIKHPIHTSLSTKHLSLPTRFKSVKRTALDCGLLSRQTLELSIKSVRGMGIWTLLRHELGREACNVIRSCVTRKYTPVSFSGYAAGGVHPYGTIAVDCHVNSPTQKKKSCNIGDNNIANFVTIEQMTNCGEFPSDITNVLQKWSALYGFEFQTLDDIGD